MPKVVVSGLGFICPIGNDQSTVVENLRELRHGLAVYSRFEAPNIPVRVVGLVKDFLADSPDPEDWKFPSIYKLRRETLRGFAPHVLFAHCALTQAIADAKLTPEDVSNMDTGLFTASAGSAMMLHHNLSRMEKSGVGRSSPLGVVSSVVGTLSYNLVAAFKIFGSSCGFASAWFRLGGSGLWPPKANAGRRRRGWQLRDNSSLCRHARIKFKP